jgi:hypothetical protein
MSTPESLHEWIAYFLAAISDVGERNYARAMIWGQGLFPTFDVDSAEARRYGEYFAANEQIDHSLRRAIGARNRIEQLISSPDIPETWACEIKLALQCCIEKSLAILARLPCRGITVTLPSDGAWNPVTNPQSQVDCSFAPVSEHWQTLRTAAAAIANSATEKPTAPKPTAEERAILAVLRNPELASLSEVAEKAGCSPQYLTEAKAPRFRAFFKANKDMRARSARIRRGVANKDGTFEAIADEEFDDENF